MRIHTVAGLAAVAMMATSYTVWSWAPPPGIGPEVEVGGTDPVAFPDTGSTVDPDADRSKFQIGDTLTMEGRLGHSVMQSGKDNESFLFVDVRADSTKTAQTPAPLNLAIVVDRSGSMKGQRLQNALDAARGMIRRLRDGDSVSVVAYNTTTSVVVPVTTINAGSRDQAIASVSSITASGDTCISCGLETGMEMLRQRTNMIDRILLLSDGQATAGVRNVAGFQAVAARCRQMGASITSIGVDVEYNERVMSALALDSNGRHHFVENAASLPRIFEQEFESLVRTVAKQAQLEVTMSPGVRVEEVFDRTFRREGDRIIIPLGTFTAAERKTLLVRMRVPRGAEGERAIANVRLAYTDLSKDSPASFDGALVAMMESDPAKSSDLDPIVLNRLSRAETAQALEEANLLFNSGNAVEARRKLEAKRADIARRSRVASKIGGTRGGEIEGDFEKQVAALDDANNGFAQPPPSKPGAPAPKPATTRKGKRQIRANQSSAADLAL